VIRTRIKQKTNQGCPNIEIDVYRTTQWKET